MGKYKMFKPPTSLLDGWKTRSSSNRLPISCGRVVGNMDAPSFLAPSQPLDRDSVAKSCQRWMCYHVFRKVPVDLCDCYWNKLLSYWKWPLTISKNRESGCFSETVLREVSCMQRLATQFRPKSQCPRVQGYSLGEMQNQWPCNRNFNWRYPLVISLWKDRPFSMGKLTINGHFQ